MVNKIIKNSASLMLQRQTTILSAAGVLMIMAVGGAALGVVKLHYFTGLLTYSTAPLLDAYRVAFMFPDLIFNIVVIGALNAAFIPVFGQFVYQKKIERSWDTLSTMINGIAIAFGLIAVLVFIFADSLVPIIAPGFKDAEQIATTAHLTRLLMVSPIFLGVSAFITGAIQVHHRFFIPALAPILYNLGAIIGIKFLYPMYGVDGLAYGIIIGSVLHLAIQIPMILYLGYRYKPQLRLKDEAVARITKLTLPRSLGLGVDRIEVVITTMLLTTLASGATTLFNSVLSLIAFPISFFGVSIAQAALPTLTKEALENKEDFHQTLLDTFHQIIYLVIPVATLMVVLKLPVIRLVLNLDSWTLTLEAAQVLLWLAPAILAQSAIHLWARASYALEDSVSPLFAGAVGVITTIVIAFASLETLGMLGVALGVAVGGFINLVMLIVFVYRKIGLFSASSFFVPLVRMAVCGTIMALALYLPVKPMEAALFDTSRTIDLIMLSTVVGGFGLSLYLFISWILGSKEIVMFIKFAHQLRSLREAFVKFPIYGGTEVASEVQANDPQV